MDSEDNFDMENATIIDGDYTDASASSSNLTKREYFAAMALSGRMAFSCGDMDYRPEEAAKSAVMAADALIQQLNSQK